MNPSTRFVILFEGRTGSSLLGSLLNQNPEVVCLGEEVAALRHQGWERQRAWIESLYFDTDNFRDRRLKDGATALGFKVKLREVASPAGLKQLLEAHRVMVVYMQRANFIKQVVSSIRAIDLFRQTGHYNLAPDQAELKPGSYRIPKKRFNDTLLWLLEAVHQLELFMATLQNPVLPSSYEALCADMFAEVGRICAFLGAGAQPVAASSIKVTSDRLRDVLENFDDLRAFYSGTNFEAMFGE